MQKFLKTLTGTMGRLSSKQLMLVAVIVNIFMTLLIDLVLTGVGAEKTVQVAQAKEALLRKVVVAKVPIHSGTIIDSSMLETVEFTEVSVPYGATEDIYAFQNLPAKVDIMPGDAVTNKKVFREVRQANFVGTVPDNCRAITVPIEVVTDLVESLNSGELVDVVLNADGDETDKVTLHDVLLLEFNAANPVANGQNRAQQLAAAGQTQDDSYTLDGTATLALSPDEILKVATAAQNGTVHLALKAVTPEPQPVVAESVRNVYESAEYSAPPQVPARRPESQVTTPKPAEQPSLPIIPSNPAPVLPEVPNMSALPLPDVPPAPNASNSSNIPNVPNNPSSGTIAGGIDVVEWGQ